ncbi:small acid-soluble spore protein SspI [Paenibacillus guangzhouensis]|uniref:small acid-soluble spore protein SspI n=1 Tax=Paenibacillus guangzhouensis TaxID=1473112 RepID=UPI001266F9E8|nr:small acid-soluble spore protein SspI [Paenibacillus guangzhouensis]
MGITLDLRQAILRKVQNKTDAEIADMIEDSIDYDEKALPGLGVLFELIWKQVDDKTHDELIHALQEKLSSDAPAHS